MINVADLQRKYRTIVDNVKKTGESVVVVNNGKPDLVVMAPKTYEAQMVSVRRAKEAEILEVLNEAQREYKAGKTRKLPKGRTLIDLLQ